jgi:hypothetical protein
MDVLPLALVDAVKAIRDLPEVTLLSKHLGGDQNTPAG